MGGSGGGYFPRSVTPGELARRTREAEARARGDTFETDVGGLLAGLLADFNSRDVEGTQAVLEKVKADIEDEVDGTIDTLFGGSVAKHTYVDGISDVDALVVLNRSDLAVKGPDEVKTVLADILRDRYGREAVTVGTLAVTVTVERQTIQLLPALRYRSGVQIASSDGRQWARANPGRFARELTAANQRLGGKLVPCIKLVKAIIATLPRKRQISGYHTEALALKVFAAYEGSLATKAMLGQFFERGPEAVRRRIRDESGQSMYVDEYLGSDNSLARRIVADALSRVGRKMRNADGAQSTERWMELFEWK